MKTIMNYFKALTNDIVGQKRYETKNEIEDLKLGLKLEDKANKKVARECDAVARASEAVKEVPRRSALASIKQKTDEPGTWTLVLCWWCREGPGSRSKV
jgi:hypothetical protein